jgi:hypothetical protein
LPATRKVLDEVRTMDSAEGLRTLRTRLEGLRV